MEVVQGPTTYEAVKAAFVRCNNAFQDPKNKRKLRDLSPRFWVALLDLEIMFSGPQPEVAEIHSAFRQAYRWLGAPGDFGYGTPCGEGLREFYDAWNAWVCWIAPAEVAT